MAVKSFKPYSAGRRFMTVASFDEITTDKPEKSLTERLKKNGGRNQQGRLTVAPASLCSTTLTARSATSWLPMASR